MRYAGTDTVSFTDASGVKRPVKDLREIPQYEARAIILKNDADSFDEIASQAEVFGSDAEGDAYLLWEANIVSLAEVGFDTTRVRQIVVPAQ